MKKSYLAISTILLMLLGTTTAANALLLGDTIDIFRGTNIETFYSQSHLVTNEVEVDNDSWLFTLDFTDDSIVFTSVSSLAWSFTDLAPPAEYYEWRFTDLDFDDGSYITGLDLSGFGYDPSRVSFTMDSVTININAFQRWWQEGDTWTIGLETGTAPVPEPATMLLLSTGLVVLAGASRKKLFKK